LAALACDLGAVLVLGTFVGGALLVARRLGGIVPMRGEEWLLGATVLWLEYSFVSTGLKGATWGYRLQGMVVIGKGNPWYVAARRSIPSAGLVLLALLPSYLAIYAVAAVLLADRALVPCFELKGRTLGDVLSGSCLAPGPARGRHRHLGRRGAAVLLVLTLVGVVTGLGETALHAHSSSPGVVVGRTP
jgi:hypothetical protein